MKRIVLFLAVLGMTVSVMAQEKSLPAGCDRAPEIVSGKLQCIVYISGDYNAFREVDVAGWRVAPDSRRWKFAVGFAGSDRFSSRSPAAGINETVGEGSFMDMFRSAVDVWLAGKEGVNLPGFALNNGGTAALGVLTTNPQAFGDEQFIIWGGRSGKVSRDFSAYPTLEFRPRLGGWKSRWRLGTQLAFSHQDVSSIEAAAERIGVTDVTISPFSPRFVRVDGTLHRSYHREVFQATVSAWQFSVGPEFEIVHGGPVDLSLEAGYAYYDYKVRSVSNLYQAPYLLFAPELFVPDIDPARLLEGGDTPLTTTDTSKHGRHRAYVGIRGEVYPFQDNLGISAGVRWYTGNLPLTRTVQPELFSPFDVHATSKHWVAQFGLTLAWSHAE